MKGHSGIVGHASRTQHGAWYACSDSANEAWVLTDIQARRAAEPFNCDGKYNARVTNGMRMWN